MVTCFISITVAFTSPMLMPFSDFLFMICTFEILFPDDIGDHLCERVLSVLFEIWLLACQKCFPSPSLWKTFRNMCINWRHHETLVVQWHKVNHALTSRLLKFLYGPGYPTLQLGSCKSLTSALLIIGKGCIFCQVVVKL